MKKVVVYDSTLRDGAQAQGISFSVKDKLKSSEIDRLGIILKPVIQFNPKDLESLTDFKDKAKASKVIA